MANILLHACVTGAAMLLALAAVLWLHERGLFDAVARFLPRLAESDRPSLFWHALSGDGSLVLTWQNVLLHRAVTNPVSFQAELKPSGSVTFRYDLSRLGSDEVLAGVAPFLGSAAARKV